MADKRCTYCDAPVTRGNHFCESCGRPVVEGRHVALWFGLGLVDTALLVFAWWAFTQSSPCNRGYLDAASAAAFAGLAVATVGLTTAKRRGGVILTFALFIALLTLLIGVLGLAGMSGYEGQCP